MAGREGFWWEGFWWGYQQMAISPVRLSDHALKSFGVWPHPIDCVVILLSLPFFSFRILEELINKMLQYDQEDFCSGKTDLFSKFVVFPPSVFLLCHIWLMEIINKYLLLSKVQRQKRLSVLVLCKTRSVLPFLNSHNYNLFCWHNYGQWCTKPGKRKKQLK